MSQNAKARAVREEPDARDAVTVAYVHSSEVSYSWHHSMIEMVGWDLANHCRILRGGYVAIRCGTDGLVEGRNRAIREFLSDRKAAWLWWVDTDMGFGPDTIDRLLEVADPEKRPIVGGLCFSHRELTSDRMGGWRCAATPTIFDWMKLEDGQQGFAVRWDYSPNVVEECSGTGSACVLIHRSVFERIQEKYGPVWYNRVPNTSTGQIVSEDLAFCLRAGALHIPIYVHTGVKTTHEKTFWLAEQDYWEQRTMPPAKERVAVIVPVLGRPQNAEPFMASLRASTGLATVYAVHDREDVETAQAWEQAGAYLLCLDNYLSVADGHPFADDDRPGTFAEKVNVGRLHSDEPWLFLVGDDVRFHPGWLDHAQALAGDRYHVVGTNDLGNPRVVAGQHATHLLIRRSYVEEVGASWDGPGIVAHEGYGHWFVDDEVVTAAKQRGVWNMALGSIVEHMHPLWGKAEDDETYRRGLESAQKDKLLFKRRQRAHLKPRLVEAVAQ